eukprot:TRINITY_DN33693_c0_g1_i1.p1 TRINITY_DN33693_c0_g1~~TRINITY_DN33693_c0_g1_i1.p1  ORF type:complete len:377 (+),score=66.08 TRINITY_DN33693_c0_g1_i1:40-1170(+)
MTAARSATATALVQEQAPSHIILRASPNCTEEQQGDASSDVGAPEERRLVITEEQMDLLDRFGVSDEFMAHCKQQELRAYTPTAAGREPLHGPVRNVALRFMVCLTQLRKMKQSSFALSMALLDSFFLQAATDMAMLPATCVALVRIAKKVDGSTSIDDICSSWLPHVQQMSGCLRSLGIETPPVTEERLSKQEAAIAKALCWKLDIPFVEQWISVFCTRFNILSEETYKPSLSWAEQYITMFARLLVIWEAPELSHSDLASGLFCIGLILARLVPRDAFRPEEVSTEEWERLFLLQNAQAAAIPSCPIEATEIENVLECIKAAINTGSELTLLKTATDRSIRMLNRVLAEMQSQQLQQASPAAQPAAAARVEHQL